MAPGDHESDTPGVSSLWDNYRTSNIRITGVPEGGQKEQETENLFEKITQEPWLVWLSGLSTGL